MRRKEERKEHEREGRILRRTDGRKERKWKRKDGRKKDGRIKMEG
jgi:hypothetical protein